MQNQFENLRNKYDSFIYNDYKLYMEDEYIHIEFDFKMGDVEFHPTTKIRTSNLNVINQFNSELGKKIVFNLGLVELVSYWKSACPKNIIVKCGYLSKDDCDWWKKLYYNGLGEFFFKNYIETDFESFVSITSECEQTDSNSSYKLSGKNIIPVGGGKDSNVTMELLKSFSADNYCFTVNDQPAREQSAGKAGYGDDKIIRTFRTIDKTLLQLNAKGYLNGHTPFSAIVAFLSLYCAYLIGAENIVLSNESSANESNIDGTKINHQYSKSFEFECDFNNYVSKNIIKDIKYFSFLRAFNELQIAKQFSHFEKFHDVFKSCNVGSKKNIWCSNCAKCLFVYIILSPFLSDEQLVKIFGENLLEKESMKDLFDGLVGFTDVKPFECIGTKQEINASLCKTIQNKLGANEKLPYLLNYYYSNKSNTNCEEFNILLNEFNSQNNIPDKFMPYVREMYNYVKSV